MWTPIKIAHLRRRIAVLAAPHALAVFGMRRGACLLRLPSPLRPTMRLGRCYATLRGIMDCFALCSALTKFSARGSTTQSGATRAPLPVTDRNNIYKQS